jgi:peptide/nickel transport system substrate-binding protein
VTFHNGDPFTAADVHYSFGRYKGLFAALLHEKVQAVEIVDAHHLRFVLHTPWPDFLTVYSALVSGAAWIVPKAYVERVGNEGFNRHPIGLGPYRFVRATPGTELVLEAYDRYWRTPPAIQRLIFKSVPEPTTSLAMLRRRTGHGGLPPDEAAAVWAIHAPAGACHDRRHRVAGVPRAVGSHVALA